MNAESIHELIVR